VNPLLTIAATIHGYDYRLVQAASPNGLFGTWSKVTAIKEALKHYDFVIFLDADAVIRYPHLPMEWLFNYWDISPNTLVAMALDPDEPQNRDAKEKHS
jgi:galactosyl transferase GMA12/MNN10 family.